MNKKKDNILKPVLDGSPVLKTTAGAGPHDKPKKAKRRDERRKAKQKGFGDE